MKIVCGACGAKYSIADEKVQGKVFKIRCKKCSNVIVVKGSDDGGDETVSESVGAAEWYVVVDGDQVGPVSKMEIDSYYVSGRVNAESFAWKDGLPDWLPLSALDDFQHLTHGDAAGPEETTQISDNFSHYQSQVNHEEADSTGIMPTASTQSDEPDDGYGGYDAGFSAFGGESEASGYEDSPSFDSASSFTGFDSSNSSSNDSGGGGGMFASFDSPASTPSNTRENDDFLGFTSPDPVPVLGSSLSSSGGGSGASAAMVNDDMVGKRNENSVLFSLSSLDQVQAVSGKSGSDSPADVPVTDGSGLIDIRALASAHKSMKSGGDDQGPSVDPFTTGTMAMPALMPMGSHRSNKPMIIGGVVALVVFLSFGSVLAYLLLTRDNTPQTQVVKEQVIVREVYKEPADDAKAAADEKAAEEAAKAAMAEPAEESGEEETAVASKSTTKKSTTSRTTKKTESAPAEKEPEAAAPVKKKGDNIDNLLAQLDSKEEPKAKTTTKTTTKKATTSSGGGKSELSRDDVQNVIRANSGRINTCYRSQNSGKLSGTMRVKFMIKPNGSIGNAEILTGSFAGTDVGSCVQKAVKGMRFPSTSASADVPITYPFKLE